MREIDYTRVVPSLSNEIDYVRVLDTTGITGTVVSFSIDDWEQTEGYYYININHNLNSLYTIVEILELNKVVYVDKIETIDQNTIRIYVPSEPDLRFNGSALIVKV